MSSEPVDLRDLPLLAPDPVAAQAHDPRLALLPTLGEPTPIPFLLLADVICACLVTLLRPDGAPTALTGLGSLLAIALLACGGLYRKSLSLTVLDELPAVVGRVLAGETVAAVIASQVFHVDLERLGSAYALLAFGFLLDRTAANAVRRFVHRRGIHSHRTLIVGWGHVANQIVSALLNYPEYGLRPMGYLDDQPLRKDGQMVLPLLGGLDDLPQVVTTHGVENVVIAFSLSKEPRLVKAIRDCERLHCEILLVPRLFELYATSSHRDMVRGLPLIRMRKTAVYGWQRYVKRLGDILAAAVGLLLVSPVMVSTALAIRLFDGREVLFRQERVGRDGRSFELLKFRSLKPASENESETTWNVSHDERMTRVGKIIRRTSIDELPQLINVLRGEMSLVGPRPERPHFVRKFADHYPRYPQRHRVACGVTGWAQIHGLRGDTSIEERILFDDYYIENWSLWLDLKILLRTPLEVFRLSGS
ncbi:MAG TPA: sugar transferase [Actinomycetota bacterium]|jgi:exopolysaccharide biosynthesis polyprenyl glycosylphosphotransferase|nr:sugar transferase [Actinomycetota bacterium]